MLAPFRRGPNMTDVTVFWTGDSQVIDDLPYNGVDGTPQIAPQQVLTAGESQLAQFGPDGKVLSDAEWRCWLLLYAAQMWASLFQPDFGMSLPPPLLATGDGFIDFTGGIV